MHLPRYASPQKQQHGAATEAPRKLTLLSQPLPTLYYCGVYVGRSAKRGARGIVSHPVTLWVLLPLLLAYLGAKAIGAFPDELYELEVSKG